jgi:hypothetical protein
MDFAWKGALEMDCPVGEDSECPDRCAKELLSVGYATTNSLLRGACTLKKEYGMTSTIHFTAFAVLIFHGSTSDIGRSASTWDSLSLEGNGPAATKASSAQEPAHCPLLLQLPS